MVLEKEIESYLTEKAKAYGGLALKWVCPSWTGVPDRIVLLPGGKIGFVETKAPGKHPRPQQARWQERLIRLGFKAYTADSKSDIDRILKEIQGDDQL